MRSDYSSILFETGCVNIYPNLINKIHHPQSIIHDHDTIYPCKSCMTSHHKLLDFNSIIASHGQGQCQNHKLGLVISQTLGFQLYCCISVKPKPRCIAQRSFSLTLWSSKYLYSSPTKLLSHPTRSTIR